jgi:hypothetical protein
VLLLLLVAASSLLLRHAQHAGAQGWSRREVVLLGISLTAADASSVALTACVWLMLC